MVRQEGVGGVVGGGGGGLWRAKLSRQIFPAESTCIMAAGEEKKEKETHK